MAPLFFSIVVVCLNPGRRLKKTVDSILGQTWEHWEIIIKDGGSSDGSLETLPADPRICLIEAADTGIYDAMNQAAARTRGDYVLFLNCGDLFYDETVLARTADVIRKTEGAKKEAAPAIYYGDQYNELQKSTVASAPSITDFTCYRNVPCHQVCFYDRRLFAERAYDTNYRVRADYEHFLYCVYERRARTFATGIVTARYEGGGFSETKENRRRSGKEHKEITKRYLGRKKCFCYGALMLATLAPLRTKIAEDPKLSVWYNRLKSGVYGRLFGKGQG